MEGNQEEFPNYAEELQKCKDFLAQYQVRETVERPPPNAPTLPPERKHVRHVGLLGHLHSPTIAP